jgi:hypothetical protein
MTILLWKDVKKALPDINKKCICKTSNGNYLISEMYSPKDANGNSLNVKRWKGSSKTVESIVKWSYLDVKEYEKV